MKFRHIPALVLLISTSVYPYWTLDVGAGPKITTAWDSKAGTIDAPFSNNVAFYSGVFLPDDVLSIYKLVKIGFSLQYSPMVSKGIGVIRYDNYLMPVVFSFQHLKFSPFSTHILFYTGGGLNFYSNRITKTNIENMVIYNSLAYRLVYRRYWPNLFWVSYNISILSELTKNGFDKSNFINNRIIIGSTFVI